MKKRLLISSVLMSAVLACALGTGTYAWYRASATINPSASAVTGADLSVSGPKDSTVDSYGVTLSATLTEVSDGDLILSHYNNDQEEGTDGWISGYYKADGTTFVSHGASTIEGQEEVYFKVYKVVLTVAKEANADADEVNYLLSQSNATYTLTFSSDTTEVDPNSEVEDDEWTPTHVATIWTVSGETQPTSTAAPGSNNPLSMDLEDMADGQTYTLGYVCVYVEGAGTIHEGTVTAHVKATPSGV